MRWLGTCKVAATPLVVVVGETDPHGVAGHDTVQLTPFICRVVDDGCRDLHGAASGYRGWVQRDRNGHGEFYFAGGAATTAATAAGNGYCQDQFQPDERRKR